MLCCVLCCIVLCVLAAFVVVMQEPRSVRDTAPLHPQESGSNKAQVAKKEVVNDEGGLRWR